jgi:hypothetical protein
MRLMKILYRSIFILLIRKSDERLNNNNKNQRRKISRINRIRKLKVVQNLDDS